MPEPVTPVTHRFQAEVSQVLRLVIHSLYSHKEIFLRELVSNASDALDKLRFRAHHRARPLTTATRRSRSASRADRGRGTLTIEDNGIGMTEEELARDLGTVAHSGSRAFLEQLAKKGRRRRTRASSGSSASASTARTSSPIASRSSRVPRGQREREPLGVAKGRTRSRSSRRSARTRGTSVTLHLKDEHKELLEAWRLGDSANRYSDYVSYPIQLGEADEGRRRRVGDAQPRERAVAAAEERDQRGRVRRVLPAPRAPRHRRKADRARALQGRRDAGVRGAPLRAEREADGAALRHEAPGRCAST